MPRAQQSLGLVHISRCAENLIVFRYFCYNVRSGGPQEHAREESSKNHLAYGLSDIPKACVTSTKISPKTLSQSLFCALCVPPFLFPMFSPFSTPHLEWSPDVERGEGEIACLAIRSEKGLRGALRENVGTTLKFVWMPLSTI